MPRTKNQSLHPIRMIDVGEKSITLRKAIAQGVVKAGLSTLKAVAEGRIEKGDVLATARIAAIQAAKETSRFLPLCHSIPLEHVDVSLDLDLKRSEIRIRTEVRATWKTGVEMEALVAASAAALTIYDMCKSMDRSISIETIQLVEKSGGRTGTWKRS